MMGNQMNYMRNSSSVQHRGNRPPYMPLDEVKQPRFDVGCDKKSIMANIYQIGFVLVETMLYLDTHPDDAEALAYFGEMREKYKMATEKYVEMFGPLQFTDVKNENYWTWVATPMPWEMEG